MPAAVAAALHSYQNKKVSTPTLLPQALLLTERSETA
jgi:hypothetical protein